MKYPKLIGSLFATGLIALMVSGCDDGSGDQAQQLPAKYYLDRVESYRQQGQYRAALIEARNALKHNPEDRAAILTLASLYRELGQIKTAHETLEKLGEASSRDEVLAMANSYLLQRKFRSAIDALEASTSRFDLANDAEANLIRATCNMEQGDLDAAERLFGALDKSNVDVALGQYRLLQKRGQVEAAEAELKRLQQAHPDEVKILSEAAHQAELKGKLDEAENLLTQAAMSLPQADLITPQKSEILQRLVTILTKLGRPHEGMIYARTLADSNPEGAMLQDKLKQGMDLFQEGKLDEAETLLMDVYGDSQNQTAGILLGMIRFARKDLDAAEVFLGSNVDPEVTPEEALTTLAATQLRLAQPQKLLQIFGAEERKHIRSPELKMLVGIALQQTGEIIEGEKLIQSARTEQPENPAMLSLLARHYLSSAKPEQAVAVLEPVVKKTRDAALSRLLVVVYGVQGQADKSLETAQALANSAPDKAENWWVLGRAGLQLQKLDVAEAALKKAIALQPGLMLAEIDLANLHLQRQQNAEAEQLFRSVLQRKPGQLGAIKGLLIALLQRDANPQAAEAELLKAADADSARAVLSAYYLRTGKLDDGKRLLNAIPADNKTLDTRQLRLQLALQRAAAALQARQFDQARSILATGLEQNPESLELLLLLADVELQSQNLTNAKKIAAQLVETYPKLSQPLELTGDIAMQERNPEAVQHYRQAWQAGANERIAHKLYGTLRSNAAEAGAFIEEWMSTLPQSPGAYFFRGQSRQEQGDFKAAIADYETALSFNPADPRALNNLAWLYSEQKDSRALATAERAYQAAPQNPLILDTYGWVLVQSGEVARGIEHLQAAQKLAPDSKEIAEHLQQATQLK